MFQSVGWDNSVWMPRLKKISCWWIPIVILLFLAEGVVFTVRAHDKYYLTDETLRSQYKDMLVPMIEKDFGPDAAQLSMNIKLSPYENVSMGLRQMNQQMSQQVEQLKSPEGQQYMQPTPPPGTAVHAVQPRRQGPARETGEAAEVRRERRQAL